MGDAQSLEGPGVSGAGVGQLLRDDQPPEVVLPRGPEVAQAAEALR